MRRILAIAHRGFSSAAPENTLAAFRKAIELKPEMMECDVRQSKDGRIVVIHDAKLDRTTSGTGPVGEKTLAELKELDAGSWFSAEFAGERIPTLEELLDLVKGSGVKLIIEIKEAGLEDAVVALIQQKDMRDEAIIGSFHYSIGVRMPELDRQIQFSPIVSLPADMTEEQAVAAADEAASVNGVLFAVNYQAISPALVKATHAANMLMEAWTVDDEETMRRMVDLGVDVIGSNNVALLLDFLKRIGARD